VGVPLLYASLCTLVVYPLYMPSLCTLVVYTRVVCLPVYPGGIYPGICLSYTPVRYTRVGASLYTREVHPGSYAYRTAWQRGVLHY